MQKSDFDFHQFISNLSQEQLEKFAVDSGSTVNYIKFHLIYKKKIPRPETIDSVVLAARGAFTKAQFVNWLYDLKVA